MSLWWQQDLKATHTRFKTLRAIGWKANIHTSQLHMQRPVVWASRRSPDHGQPKSRSEHPVCIALGSFSGFCPSLKQIYHCNVEVTETN
eukprot:3371876-Amphidinium_carterae.1